MKINGIAIKQILFYFDYIHNQRTDVQHISNSLNMFRSFCYSDIHLFLINIILVKVKIDPPNVLQEYNI